MVLGILEIWRFNFRICSLKRDRRVLGVSGRKEEISETAREAELGLFPRARRDHTCLTTQLVSSHLTGWNCWCVSRKLTLLSQILTSNVSHA